MEIISTSTGLWNIYRKVWDVRSDDRTVKDFFSCHITAADLMQHVGQSVKLLGEFVCDKSVHTKNNKTMWFGTFLDVNGDFFDTTHFPNNTPR